MSDLYLGVLIVIGAMTLIFFGPELWKSVSRKFLRSRRRAHRSRAMLKKGIRVRSRKISVIGSFAH
jgi:hypothetical protein